MKQYKYEFSFRVNDTTITHITVHLPDRDDSRAYKRARGRLQNRGYTVNECVTVLIKEVERA